MRSLITLKVLFFIVTLFICIVTTSAQTNNVGIGTTTPDNSAILELLSTTKGLLIPRLTSPERDAITSPATSLIIYNTSTNQFEFNYGTPAVPNWIGLASILNLTNVYGSGSDGQVTYWNSSSTITGSNDLFWNNSSKKLGIGNNTPRERLDLVDTSNVGALIIGNAENTNAGTIRWSGTDFEGYDGSQWLSFTASSTINGNGSPGQITFWSGPGLLSGSNNLYWDITNNILGIGTNTPSSTVTLDVNGNARIQGDLEISGEVDPVSLTLQPQNSSPSAIKGKIYYNNIDNKLNVYDGSSWKDIDSWTESGGNVYRTSGRVGIGTNTPQERLDLQDLSGNGAIVVGNSSASISGIIKFDGFDYYGYIDPNWVSLTTGGGGGGSSTITGAGAAGQVTIWSGPSSLTGSNNLFWNNVAGKLGIGDNTPDHVLDVAGNIGLDLGSYINFGDDDGIIGYGFRDNSGIIEFKNSGGSWQNFSALSGGDVYGGGTGSVGQVAFWNSSSTITGVNRLFWDNNNTILRIGSNGYSGGLLIFSEQGGTDYQVMFQPNSSMTESTTYTLPPDYGSSGQVLTTDGNGLLNWTSVSGGGGGDVYGNGSNGQIAFWNSSSTITGVNNLFWNNSQSILEIVGTIQAGGNGTSGAISLFSEQGGTDYNVMFIPNSSMTESTTYTLPPDYGSSGQVLTTDGNGLLNWTSVSGGGGGGDVYGNGSNGQIAFWNSSSTITGVNNLFWNNAESRLEVVSTIQLGKNGTSGALDLFSEQGGTDYNVMFIPNSSMTESTTYTLPPDAGSNGQVLSTDGNGVLNWTTILGGGGGNVFGTGTDTYIAFWNSSNTITGSSNLVWDYTNTKMGIGDASPDHTLDVSGNIGMDVGSYVNFGDIDGNTGYGFWDDSGIIKYKNDGGSWQAIPGGNTLDMAYNQGGSGAGKFIAVNAGTVGLYGSNSGTYTMELTNSANGGVLRIDNNGTGNSVIVNESTGNYPLTIKNNGRVGIGTTNPSAMLELVPQTTDAIIINPNLTATPTNLKFLDAAGGEYVGFVAPNAVSASVIWVLPTSDGASGQVLATDGSGVLSWTNAGGVTLNGAYNYGGAGAGRIITVNSGSVDLQGSNVADYTLKLSNSANGGVLNLDNNGTGNGIYLESGASNYPFVVSSSGMVGIGITNPSAQLEISPTGNDAIIINPNTSPSPTTLKFLDAAGGDYVGFVAPNAITTSVVWTLPPSDGTSGQVLATNGSGILSWSTAGLPGGNDGTVQYNNGGAFNGDDNFFWDDVNKRLGLGTNTPDATLNIVGGSGVNALHIRSGENDGVDFIMHLEDTDGSVQAMYVDVNGNVGLGTTTPVDRLHVQGAVLREGWLMVNKNATQNINNNGVNNITWDNVIRVDSPTYYSFSLGSADINITQTGWYRISFNLNFQNNGGDWVNVRTWIVDDGTEIIGSSAWVLIRDNASQDFASCSNSFIAQISASSVLQVQVQRQTAQNFSVLVNSQITIERIDE